MLEYLTFDDVQILPRYSEVMSRSSVDTSARFTSNFDIRVPLVAAPMDTVCELAMAERLAKLGAVGCVHRFGNFKEQSRTIYTLARSESRTISPVVGTIGVTGDYQGRAEALVSYGANVLLIDVANGHHKNVKDAMRFLNGLSYRKVFDVILGNVSTLRGALDLQDWGADALRVGIGGGSMCETRIRTGIGSPQLSTIMTIADSGDITVPIISDGGIRSPGDVAKALAAGADTVMIGSMLAGTTESPGEEVEYDGVRKKLFRGSASAAVKAINNQAIRNVEGTHTLVNAKGSVESVINMIMDGVRSCASYLGVHRTSEIHTVAEFVRITNSGITEARPHGVK